MVQAVIFDAFGTLVRIARPTHPYRQLLALGVAQGRAVHADDRQLLMGQPLGLEQAAQRLGIALSSAQLALLQAALDEELESIELWPDTQPALDWLQTRGFKLALCSNLALPYGAPLARLFGSLQGQFFSYEQGCLKPDPELYRRCCRQLGVTAADCVMIGDSPECDCDGPTAAGLRGYLLGRLGKPGDYPDLLSFARALSP